MIKCPDCGAVVSPYRNPSLTVDLVIEYRENETAEKQIVFIKRRNEPRGTAFPGGFVDYGENVETAAAREAKEETGLEVTDLSLLGVYSDPERDPRGHTVSVVFVARATGKFAAGDDAEDVFLASLDSLPDDLVFDHAKILKDYINN